MAGLLSASRSTATLGSSSILPMSSWLPTATTRSAPGSWRRLDFRRLMTGFGSAASRLGRTDVGPITLPEMVDNARRVVQTVDVPVIADPAAG